MPSSVEGGHVVEVGERRGRSVARLVALVAVTGLLVAGIVAGWRWHTHPHTFPEAGNAWSGPLRADRDFMLVGMTGSVEGAGTTVTLHSANAVVRRNTVGATYEVYVCTSRDDTEQLGMLSGARAFEEYCPDAERVREGTTLHTGDDPRQQLVLLVRMSGEGVSVTDGVALDYTDGLRSGTQVVGPQVRLTAGPAPGSAP